MTMTISSTPGTDDDVQLDLARMRRDRLAKLQVGMAQDGLDALVLAGNGNVSYATGARGMTSEIGRAVHEPVVAIVPRDGPPHIFTPYPEGAPSDRATECVHPPLLVEFPDGVKALAGALTDLLGRGELNLAFDMTSAAAHELLPQLLPKMVVNDAEQILGPAKLVKTDDELECIRRAQRINELAMYDVYAALEPGVRQSDLSGIFLRRIFELGASANSIDPIWQATPAAIADGPFTVHGDVAFPTCSSDRILRQDDLVLVDSGLLYEGYASDFGRTWLAGGRLPTSQQRDHFKRWHDVIGRVLAITRPGTTGLELHRAACENEHGRRPWFDHFYLVHGIGTESAEMPFIGTDLGEEFDESIVLAPGMVMVLEPVIWEDGAGGYRSEDIVAVTDDGYRLLSSFPYLPFDEGPSSW